METYKIRGRVAELVDAYGSGPYVARHGSSTLPSPTITLMKKQKVIPIIFDTYIAVIKNSVGSKMFRNSYAKINDKKTDILQNGMLSCAFFVSSILVLFKLIKEIHGTVDGTVRDLEQSGWQKTTKPKIGSVIVWEKIDFGNKNFHKHIGFYIGNNKAISTNNFKNNFKKRQIVIHHWTYGIKRNKPIRKVEQIFWNKKLN